jgi:hypothetical protein
MHHCSTAMTIMKKGYSPKPALLGETSQELLADILQVKVKLPLSGFC